MRTVTIIIWRVWYNGSYTMIWWLGQSELQNCIIQWFRFLIMPIAPSYSPWNLRSFLWMWKAQLPAKQICVPSIKSLNQKLQTTKMKFEKLLCWQVFKNTSAFPFQSSSSLSICASFFFYVIYTFLQCFEQFFMFHSVWCPFPMFEFWWISWHSFFKRKKVNKHCKGCLDVGT